ncbi:FAD-binding protein [Niallia circulans]|uniref:FAD-binding protein n=1 Tax=Niallia circulans TaxID=1397 RepID=A0A553SJL7_NIACI|nr:FAD-dependent monooxygenase [Niallia circulans]TRZ37177.1 FAD-binding protein [Niallia circulans]
MTVLNAEVCIVGAGPGGAMLAYLLSTAGVSTILLERHHDVDKEFRGEHLNEEGEQVLKSAGLFSKLKEKGILCMSQVDYIADGKVVKSIHPHPEVGHTGIHVPQKHLLKLLLEESSRNAAFRLEMDSAVKELIQTETGEYSGVIAVIDGVETVVNSKIIVGADGRFSTIRKKGDFPVEAIKHGYDLLWAKIPAPSNWEPAIKMALVQDSQLALFTQYGGFIQIGWNIEEGSFPTLRKGSISHFTEQLLSAFPELKESVHAHIKGWKNFVLLKVESSKSKTWINHNVILLGDAAHTMSPTGAFGLNSSLKDAEVLAELLQRILHQHETMDLLKIYETVRKTEVEKVQEEQLRREAAFKDHFPAAAVVVN